MTRVTLRAPDDPPEAKAALDGLTAFNLPFLGAHGHRALGLRRAAKRPDRPPAPARHPIMIMMQRFGEGARDVPT